MYLWNDPACEGYVVLPEVHGNIPLRVEGFLWLIPSQGQRGSWAVLGRGGVHHAEELGQSGVNRRPGLIKKQSLSFFCSCRIKTARFGSHSAIILA